VSPFTDHIAGEVRDLVAQAGSSSDHVSPNAVPAGSSQKCRLGQDGLVGPIPDPAICPTVSVEDAGVWLGLGRSSAYEAARRGEIPILRFGRTLRVPTARLRVLLGIDQNIEIASSTARLLPMRRDHAT
jgi:excisionase family DNA binding protein